MILLVFAINLSDILIQAETSRLSYLLTGLLISLIVKTHTHDLKWLIPAYSQ